MYKNLESSNLYEPLDINRITQFETFGKKNVLLTSENFFYTI